MSPHTRTRSLVTQSHRRVVVVDDDEILRLALYTALTRAGWDVVGEAADGRAGVEVTLAARPEIVVMDLSMPVMDGIEAIREIRAKVPGIEVVFLTATENQTVFEALKAGASGYLLKGMPLNEIVDSLEETLTGGSPISPKIARMVLSEFAGRATSPPPAAPHASVDLSDRETEILRLLVDGQTAAGIGEQLFISVHTVNTHVRNIYRKLEVTSRAQAVSRALRDGLV